MYANRPLPALYVPRVIPGPKILQRDHVGEVILFVSLSFKHFPPSPSFLCLNSSPMSQSCKLYKVSSHLSNGVIILSSHFHCWIISCPLASSRFPVGASCSFPAPKSFPTPLFFLCCTFVGASCSFPTPLFLSHAFVGASCSDEITSL